MNAIIISCDDGSRFGWVMNHQRYFTSTENKCETHFQRTTEWLMDSIDMCVFMNWEWHVLQCSCDFERGLSTFEYTGRERVRESSDHFMTFSTASFLLIRFEWTKLWIERINQGRMIRNCLSNWILGIEEEGELIATRLLLNQEWHPVFSICAYELSNQSKMSTVQLYTAVWTFLSSEKVILLSLGRTFFSFEEETKFFFLPTKSMSNLILISFLFKEMYCESEMC